MSKDGEYICPVPGGILLLIGGHEDKGQNAEDIKNKETTDILKTFVELSGGENAKIEVITSATKDGAGSFKEYERTFKKLGVNRIGHIHHGKRSDALAEGLAERISLADAVFFSGGNQLKLTSIYGGTPFLMQLKSRYIHERIVIAGTSAGAMAFSTPMIFAGNKEVQQIAGKVRITTGLEFLKDVCIDTHFVDRSRFIRLAQVVATNPSSIGIGIEENTALIIRDGYKAEVIGNGVVVVIEGFKITDSSILNYDGNDRIYIDNLTVRILAQGNHYGIPENDPPHR